MKYFSFLLLFSVPAFAIDFGNGSLGACNDATFAAGNGGIYQCDSVVITGAVTFNPGQPAVIILARDSIDISGSISLNAQAGSNGVNGAANDTIGGNGGAGGSKGGDYLGLTNSEQSGRGGSGSSAGGGGTGNWVGANNGAGGGGAGNGTGGNAGNAASNTAGSAGAKAIAISGGSGGGAGGAGNDGIFVYSAGSGGGGAGFLTLRSSQKVIISGIINANGGNGGAGSTASGGGGGGSGGTLHIQSISGADINGTINIAGGTGGNGGVPGVGGNGGLGRLKIETAGASNINTSGMTLTAGVTVETGDLFTNEFEGVVATGCGSVDLDGGSSGPTTFLLVLLFFLALPTITNIKHHRRH